MADLTDWFAPEFKPLRPGWYETKGTYFAKQEAMTWWSGSEWCWASLEFEMPTKGFICLDQYRQWRGLTKPSSK